MHGILCHGALFCLEVTAHDSVDAAIVVEIFGVDAEGMLLGKAVEIIAPEIAGDIVCVSIPVEVACRKAVPPSGVTLEVRPVKLLK
jgi:hypothetical protein